jgi:hypothetical protein
MKLRTIIATHRFALFLFAAILHCFITFPLPARAGDTSSYNLSVSHKPIVNDAFANSCAGCHTDDHAVPWSEKIAPSYLFGAEKARRTLNFDQWRAYDAGRQAAERTAIATAITQGTMPPADFLFLRSSGKLTDAEKLAILEWARTPSKSPSNLSSAPTN